MSMIHTWRLNPQKVSAWNFLLKSLETELSLKLLGDFWIEEQKQRETSCLIEGRGVFLFSVKRESS